MAPDNNAAARLLHFLESARQQANSLTAVHAWSRVFSLSETDTMGVFKSLNYLLDLTEETERLILKIHDLEHEKYLGGMGSIKKGLSYPNLSVPWEMVKQHFSDKALTHLLFCAERIGKRFPEEIIPDDILQDIENDINSLFDKVSKSSIRDAFKELLLDLLERMRRGISEYRIRGADGLREALETTIGRLVMKRTSVAESSIGEEEKTLFDGIKGILIKFDWAIDRAVKVKMLAGYAKSILEKYMTG